MEMRSLFLRQELRIVHQNNTWLHYSNAFYNYTKSTMNARKCLCVKALITCFAIWLIHTEIQRAPSSLLLPHTNTHTLLSRPGACKQPKPARITHSPLSLTHSPARKNTHSNLQAHLKINIFMRATNEKWFCLDQKF
jgi:hypothetical protein